MNLTRLLRRFSFVMLGALELAHASQSVIVGQEARRVKWYENSTSPPHLNLIESAKTSLDFEVYTMTDMRIWRAISRALDRGVVVRVIKDPEPVGQENCKILEPLQTGEVGDCREIKLTIEKIRQRGAVVAFNKENLCGRLVNCFEHGKMMIVDRTRALISTGNFDPTSLCGLENLSPAGPDDTKLKIRCNRDYSVVIDEASGVSALREIFERDLRGSAYPIDQVVEEVRSWVTVSPIARASVLSALREAKREVWIQNQYLKDPEMNAVLADLARRQVTVNVNVASFCSFGRPKPSERRKIEESYGAFDRLGIRSRAFTSQIRVAQGTGYLHAKAFVIDGELAWIASINGSATAFDRNREFGVFIQDSEQVDALERQIKSDFLDSGSESWQESLDCVKDRMLTSSFDQIWEFLSTGLPGL